MRTGLAALAAGLLTVSPAAAQDRPAGPPGIEARVAAGIVWHGAVFGDDNPKGTRGLRPVISALVRGRADKSTGFTFEAALEPFGIANPHFDERVHTLHLLGGFEMGRRVAVRPSLGMAVQFWTGSSAETPVSLAIAAGLAVGAPRKVEFIARGAVAPGVGSLMAGVQMPFPVGR